MSLTVLTLPPRINVIIFLERRKCSNSLQKLTVVVSMLADPSGRAV
jgi:hypothetical protein